MTLNRQLDVFRHVLKVARNDWGLPLLENPFAQVTRPRMDSSRSRRIQSGEWDRLETACRQCRNPYLLSLVELALETAMRRGELLGSQWRHVNLAARTLHIPITKNGHPRTIPLTSRAVSILECLKKMSGSNEEVIPISLMP
jgi:integrase